MRNQETPVTEEREATRTHIRNAALFQASVDAAALDEFYLFGSVSEATTAQRNEAGQRYNEAIRGMLDFNRNL